MWKLFFLSLLLSTSSRLIAQTKPPDVEQARVLGLENAWARAVKQKDVSALQMMLATAANSARREWNPARDKMSDSNGRMAFGEVRNAICTTG